MSRRDLALWARLLVWSPVWVPLLAADVVVAYALRARDLLVSGRPERRPDQPGRW